MSTPDGVDFRADGTIRITIDGQNYTVRRPKWGEYKAARESLYAMNDQLRDLADMPDDGPANETDDEKAARTLAHLRAATREITDRTDEITGDWIERALGEPLVEDRGALIDKPLPDRSAWPTFMVTSDFIVALQEHWRSVPLARSAPSKKAR